MAKEYRRECPDCDFTHSFLPKGDGRCKYCDGTGKRTDIGDVIGHVGTFGMAPGEHACEYCAGTGQCQTCGGTGYQYYGDNSPSNAYSREDDTSSESYYESSYNSGPRTEKWDSGDTTGVITGLVILAIIIAFITNMKCNKNSSESKETSFVEPSQPYDDPPSKQPCEQDQTGTYIFKNSSSEKIFIIITSLTAWKKHLEIEPRSKISIAIPVSDLEYSYSYGFDGAQKNSYASFDGNLKVIQCSSTEIELQMPPYEVHRIDAQSWSEIQWNSEIWHTIIASKTRFSFRLHENDQEHNCNGIAIIPPGYSTIFIKNNSENDTTFIIQEDK